MLSKDDRELIDRVCGLPKVMTVDDRVCITDPALLSALLAAARTSRQVPEWEPIETAPGNTHHMNHILVFWKTRGWQQTYWDVDEEFSQRPKGWRSPECGWRCDGDQCIPVDQETATHWMFGPAPPNPLRPDLDGGVG